MNESSALTQRCIVRRAIANAILILVMLITGCREDGSDSNSADGPDVAANHGSLPELPDAKVLTEDPAIQAQFSEAVQSVQQSPNNAQANGRLAMIYHVYSVPDAAATCYRRAAMLSGREFKWHYLLGSVQREIGEANEAVTSLSQAISINAVYAPAHVALGDVYLELGEIDKAEAAFRRAQQIDMRSCAALIGLGKVLASRGEHTDALAFYRQALEIAPNYSPLHYAMGLSLRETSQLGQAKSHFGQANTGTKQLPDRDPIRSEVFALELGLHADYLRAQAKIDAGDLDGAIKILRSLIEIAPNYYGARGRLAFALDRKGDSAEALKQYEQAVRLNPDNVDFLRPYALLLTRNKRLEEARKSMVHVIELSGEHADDYEVLGVILSMLNRRHEAIEQFEISLKHDPTHARSRKNLILLLHNEISASPNEQAMLPYLIRYVELKPPDARPYIMLGRILDRKGDLKGALQAFDGALLINPNTPDIKRRANEIRQQLESTPPR